MSVYDYLDKIRRTIPARRSRTGQAKQYARSHMPGTLSHTRGDRAVPDRDRTEAAARSSVGRKARVIDRNTPWSPYEDPVTVNGFALPHVLTFSGIMSSAARAYSWRWDEAYRQSRFNAVAMRKDCFLMGLMNERKLATAQLNWHLEPENKNDALQVAVAAQLDRIVRAIPDLHRIFMALLEAIWYGRYAVQLSWNFDNVADRRVLMPTGHSAVNGDKIQYTWDGVPSVLVHASHVYNLPDKWLITTDRTTALLLKEDFWRRRFIIHKHQCLDEADFFEPEAAGAVHGLGVRHFIYWMNWVRNEYIADVMDFMKRVGLGLTVLYYEAGNKESERKAIEAGENIGDRAVIAWPRPIGSEKMGAGIDRLEVPVSGAGLLVELQRHLEDHIERYMVGQMMSGGSDQGSSGWGGEKANFAKDTKYRLTKHDADNLSGTLTTDLLNPLKEWNYPWANFPVRFVFDVDSPDPQARMEAAKWLHDMDVPLDGGEVREVAGFSAPRPDGEVILGATSKQAATAANNQGGRTVDGGGPGENDSSDPTTNTTGPSAPQGDVWWDGGWNSGAEQYEVRHAPEGGSRGKGKDYKGGQFVPSDASDSGAKKSGKKPADASAKKVADSHAETSAAPQETDPAAGRPTKPKERKNVEPPKNEWKAPPPPKGQKGKGKAGGFTATGHTNTEFGDMAEAALEQLGLRSILPPGKRQNPLDREYDHSGIAFEVKACSTSATEYKAKPKASELESKRKYAEEHGLRGGTMIAVVDTETREIHAYWREGLGAFALNPNDGGKLWNYMGTVKY